MPFQYNFQIQSLDYVPTHILTLDLPLILQRHTESSHNALHQEMIPC